jgi:hypothetical protein
LITTNAIAGQDNVTSLRVSDIDLSNSWRIRPGGARRLPAWSSWSSWDFRAAIGESLKTVRRSEPEYAVVAWGCRH